MALNRAVPGAESLGKEFGTSALGGGLRSRWSLGAMVGRSSAMERIFLQMRYLANHLRLGLIEGERGTGKLLTAQTLHALGTGQGGSFVACPAEEFFSGAAASQRLEEAAGGTLYLSRIDVLKAEQQGRLLHLLGWLQAQAARNSQLRPVLAGTPPPPRALLVSTERALRSLVLYGKFRNELHQQLSPVQLLLPPLRERRGDIAVLADHFLAQCSRQYGKTLRGISPEGLQHLGGYSWPGNVRELETVISRAALRCGGEWLHAGDLLLGSPAATPEPAASRGPAPGLWREPSSSPSLAPPAPTERPRLPEAKPSPTLDPNLDRAIVRHIRRVLASVEGNKLQAARLLGISRSTLYRLLDADASGKSSGQADEPGGAAVAAEQAPGHVPNHVPDHMPDHVPQIMPQIGSHLRPETGAGAAAAAAKQ